MEMGTGKQEQGREEGEKRGSKGEIRNRGSSPDNIDLFVKEEESFGIDGPMWRWGVELHGCDGVGLE